VGWNKKWKGGGDSFKGKKSGERRKKERYFDGKSMRPV